MISKLLPNIAILIYLINPAFGQTFNIVYGDNESVHNCAMVSLSDSTLIIEYNPVLPGAPEEKRIPISDIVSVRYYSWANRLAPWVSLGGAMIGVSLIKEKVDPDSKETLSELFLNIFETPIYFAGGLCVGGAIGYLVGHFAFGGNGEQIIFYDMPHQQKINTLQKLILTSHRLWRFPTAT